MPASTKKDEPQDEQTAAPPESAPPKHATQYKVTSAGLTGAGGVAHYRDEILSAEQIDDQARIDKLLAKKAIEAL